MSDQQRKLISDYVDKHKDELIHYIQKAVQIKSLVGQEQEMQQFMKERYEEIG